MKSLNLKKRGVTIISCRSCARQGINDIDTVAIRDLNDYLVQDERVALSMVPVGDGLTIAFIL